MKKIKRLLVAVGILALTACSSSLPTTAGPAVGVSFQFFYDNLSPYGTWVSYPSHGYVWMPRAPVGFRPYFSSGHWVHTPEGWMWVSFYDWGWAPFHYGSWLYDPFYGWLWVPGYHWAPAWVTWGYHSGYYGWAPIGPGVSFHFGYYPPIDYWVFVPPQYVTVAGWNNTYYTSYNNRIAFDNNTAISNVRSIDVVKNAGTYNGQRFSAGPSVEQFERAANTKVNTVSIKDNNTAAKTRLSGDNVTVYRPRVDVSDKSTARPSKTVPLESMKRSGGERSIDNNADRIKRDDGSRIRSRETEKRAVPESEIRRERAPEKTSPEIRREREPERKAAPAQREQPGIQERRQDIDRQAAPRRNENVQPRTKERQQEVRPKPNVESPSPQRNVEPRQQYRESPKQAPVERMERPQPQPQPRVAPERRQQMEKTTPREPRYQPQPPSQPREKGGPRSPK